MHRRQFVAALVFGPVAAKAFNPGAPKSSVANTAVSALRPGEFIWTPQMEPQGPMTIFVNLVSQRAFVYRNGVAIGASTVSTGKPGHETPTGVFTILQKDRTHHSNRYNNASMPFTERLTWGGVALHAGGLPGYPSSHGCVHLPLKFSQLLFSETSLGMTVIITKEAPRTRTLLSPTVLRPANASADSPTERLEAGQDFKWQPELSPNGPMAIVASSADERALVLRNGIIIGRARVIFPPGRVVGMHALQFKGFDKNGIGKWFYISIPGSESSHGEQLSMDFRKGIVIPPKFYADVRSVVEVGTTMLLTDISVVDTGEKVTVIATS
jgi:hypothetical protein